MQKTIRMTIVVASSGLLLAGCQSPLMQKLGLAPKRTSSPTALAGPAPQVAGVQQIEEGRAQLRAGQLSAAVASFRLARLDPAFVAEAENGLGVAYAKLGRPDLAERYFRSAIERAPGNTRFAANFLRLRNEVMLASARTAPRPMAAAPQVAAANPALRVADGVVHIRTSEPAAAPRMAIAFLDPPKPAPVPVVDQLAAGAQTGADSGAIAPEPAPLIREKVVLFPQ